MHSRARKFVSILLIVLMGLSPLTGAVAGSNHCEADTSESNSDSSHAGHDKGPTVARAADDGELAQACADCDEGCCSLAACQDNACGPNVFALVSRSEFSFRKGFCSLSSAQQRLACTERISSPYRPPRA